MYFEIARRICEKIGVGAIQEINGLEKEVEKSGEQYIDFTEIPILPCVAKIIDLPFITEETMYRVKFTERGQYRGTKETIRLMNRKEWIYAYIAYTRAQITLGELWNTNIEEVKEWHR